MKFSATASVLWRFVLLLAAVVLVTVGGLVVGVQLFHDGQDGVETTHSPVENLPSGTPDDRLRTNAAPLNPPITLLDSPDRVAAARERCGKAVAARFAAAGISYPPAEIFLRVFKHEGQLELWAGSSAGQVNSLRLVSTYPIQRASGRLGPKRQEGDRQVPEGFYWIDRFNPQSLFHLSLGLNYPNTSDRILTTDQEHPGSDVFIHGGYESIGCLAVGDPAIEEIYLAAWDAKLAGQKVIPVHIFPCRLDARQREELLSRISAGDGRLEGFWRSLQAAYDQFEQSHRVPKVLTLEDGSYACPASPDR